MAETRKLGLKVALAGLAAYKSASRDVRNGNEAMKDSFREAASDGRGLDVRMIALGTTLGNLATNAVKVALRGLKSLGNQLKSMIVEAGPVKGLTIAFESLTRAAGTSAEEMVAAMQKSLGGMAAQRDMMKSFNKAAQLISLDFAKTMPEAMKYLGKVAFATGEDMNYLMNSLVVGIGRMSPMILDNMAIQVKLSEATARATEMYGLQADQLSKTQKQMGLASVVMEKLKKNTEAMPDVAGSAVAGIQALGAVLQDTKDQIGMALLPIWGEFMGMMKTAANSVLPRVAPVIESIVAKLMELFETVKRFIPVKDIVTGLKDAFVEMKQGVENAIGSMSRVWTTWSAVLQVDFQNILSALRDKIIPFFQELPQRIAAFWERIGPVVQQAAQYFIYFYRIASNILKSFRSLIEGDVGKAAELFTDAWQTAVAIAITILRNLVTEVWKWGTTTAKAYAEGIIAGITTYLKQALSAIASYMSAWMSPGSAPKFLPDIGTWGRGAMRTFLEGMGQADYSILADFSGKFREVLGSMAEFGDLDRGSFADIFFELRGTVAGLIDEFRETGQVSSVALDVIREKLGRVGIAYADLLDTTLQYEKAQEGVAEAQEKVLEVQRAIQDMRDREVSAIKALRGLYETGEIGAEEYEDRVKALRKEADEQEEIAVLVMDQAREEEVAARARASELEEQMGIIKAQIALHEETRSVLAEQSSLMEEVKDTASAIGKGLKEGIAEAVAEMPKLAESLRNIIPDRPDLLFPEIVWGEGFDLGELLPDVEETKAQVKLFFEETLGKAISSAFTAIREHPAIKTLIEFFETLGPKLGKAFFWLRDKAIPWVIVKFKEFKEVVKDVWEWIKKNGIPTLAGLAAAFATLKIAALITGIGTLTTSFIALAPAILAAVPALLAAAAAAAPLILLAAAIGTLTFLIVKFGPQIKTTLEQAGFIINHFATKAWTKITDFTTNTWNSLVTWATDTWTKIKEWATNIKTTVTTWATEVWTSLQEWFANLKIRWGVFWTKLRLRVAEVWKKIVESIQEGLETARQWFVDKLAAIKQGWTDFWTNLFAKMGLDLDEMKKRWAAIWADVVLIVSTVWTKIKSWVLMKLGELAVGILLKILKVSTWLTEKWDAIKTKATETWTAIVTWITTKVGEIWTAITTKIGEIATAWTEKWDEVETKATDIWTTISTTVTTKVGEIWTTITTKVAEIVTAWATKWDAISTKLGEVWDTIVTAVTDKAQEIWDAITGKIGEILDWLNLETLITKFTDAGEKIVQGMIDGIANMAGDLIASITGGIEDAITAAKKLLGIDSPSKVFAEIGMNMGSAQMSGYMKSMRAMVPDLQSQLQFAIDPVRVPARQITNNTNSSVSYGDRSIQMTVYLGDQISLTQFQTKMQEVLNARG